VATCSTHLEPKLATLDTVPSAATRCSFPSSPEEMKPSPLGPGEIERGAVVDGNRGPVVRCVHRHQPYGSVPEREPARRPSREKRMATTNASSSRRCHGISAGSRPRRIGSCESHLSTRHGPACPATCISTLRGRWPDKRAMTAGGTYGVVPALKSWMSGQADHDTEDSIHGAAFEAAAELRAIQVAADEH